MGTCCASSGTAHSEMDASQPPTRILPPPPGRVDPCVTRYATSGSPGNSAAAKRLRAAANGEYPAAASPLATSRQTRWAPPAPGHNASEQPGCHSRTGLPREVIATMTTITKRPTSTQNHQVEYHIAPLSLLALMSMLTLVDCATATAYPAKDCKAASTGTSAHQIPRFLSVIIPPPRPRAYS